MLKSVGVPKEVKDQEYRVGLTPAGVYQLVEAGHEVRVETGAGEKVGFPDEIYKDAGAKMLSASEIYSSDLIVKVKEPISSEFDYLREGKILFCFLHLAAEPRLTQTLVDKKVTAIAYETVTDHIGRLPLLEPMSEIAGRLSVQIGASFMQLNNGGPGILLGGVPGVPAAQVVIIGGGVAGTQAAIIAMGMGAQVTVIDKDLTRLRYLDTLYGPLLQTLYATPLNIEAAIQEADLVVAAVLVPGKASPKIISRKMISKMRPGTVFVDVSIDQGGASETSRPTSHSDPIYVVDGVIHYCVTNIPGAASRTGTLALTHATHQHVMALARRGLDALRNDPHLRNGLNTFNGQVTNEAVAMDLGHPYTSPDKALA